MKKTIIILALTAIVLTGCGDTPTEEELLMEANGNAETTQWITFEGDGFTFEYPNKYVADKMGLWTKNGYEKHINPPENCSICQIPYIGIITAKTPISLEEFIVGKHQLPGETLAEIEKSSGITFYEMVKVGDYEFTKILVNDMYEVTTYYTRNDFTIVGFQTFLHEVDLVEQLQIMKTLKF